MKHSVLVLYRPGCDLRGTKPVAVLYRPGCNLRGTKPVWPPWEGFTGVTTVGLSSMGGLYRG